MQPFRAQAGVLMTCLAMTLWPAAAVAVDRYQGQAYVPGGATLLYREMHWRDGNRHVVLYTCPDGKAFARKHLDTSPGEMSPDFEMEDGRDGYRQGVRSGVAGRKGPREVFVRTSKTANERLASLASTPVIDAGFDQFVVDNWARLAKGEVIPMSFLVPSRLEAMQFNVRQVAAGKGKRTFRLALDNMLGGLLPRIDVDYDAQTRRLLAYRGLTDIRDGRGGNIKAEIRFPAAMRTQADAASLAEALAAPLDGRCRQ